MACTAIIQPCPTENYEETASFCAKDTCCLAISVIIPVLSWGGSLSVNLSLLYTFLSTFSPKLCPETLNYVVSLPPLPPILGNSTLRTCTVYPIPITRPMGYVESMYSRKRNWQKRCAISQFHNFHRVSKNYIAKARIFPVSMALSRNEVKRPILTRFMMTIRLEWYGDGSDRRQQYRDAWQTLGTAIDWFRSDTAGGASCPVDGNLDWNFLSASRAATSLLVM